LVDHSYATLLRSAGFFFIFVFHMGPLFGLLHQPQMRDDDDDDCGAIDRMRIIRGNRSTRRKRAPVPLRPP
jgi:hypothetical protein